MIGAAPGKSTIRVVLVDDHEVVRHGLVALFDTTSDIKVVGQAGTVADAIKVVDDMRPDVAVLDVRLPDSDGIAACREITARFAGVRCLILTSHSEDEAVYAAVVSGASGFLLKDVSAATIVDAVRRVGSGQSLLDPATTAKLFERLRRSESVADPLARLSQREMQLLDLIAEGLTNKQIGARLFLAEKTVKNYVSALLTKLGYQRRTQIAALAATRRD